MDADRIYQNSTVLAHCPACGAGTFRSIGALPYADHVTFAGVPVRLADAPYLAECLRCHSWFSQNIIDQASALSLYENGQGDLHWKGAPFEQCKSAELVNVVRSLVRRGANVVDFGCNTGELLDFCSGLGGRTFGIEANRAAQDVCRSKGHAITHGLDQFSDEIDVIFAFDLVEHLYDIAGFVGAARAALRPGGVLAILTGSIDSVAARRFRERWWYVGYPEHILFPSWTFWKSLAGFDARRMRTYASRAYEPSPIRRLQAMVWASARRGRGLPLLAADHHFVMLTRT